MSDLVLYSQRVYPREQRALRAVRYYERGLARLKGEWKGTGNPGTSFADESNLYTNDLDIFGEGSLFELLCTARTQAGQETLAQWLSMPASRNEILSRQEAIEELRNNIDLREDMAILGREMKTTVQPEVITGWATAPILLESTAARIAAPILVAATIAAFTIHVVLRRAGVPAFGCRAGSWRIWNLVSVACKGHQNFD